MVIPQVLDENQTKIKKVKNIHIVNICLLYIYFLLFLFLFIIMFHLAPTPQSLLIIDENQSLFLNLSQHGLQIASDI